MQSKAATPELYLSELPEDRKSAMSKIRKEIKDNLPEGFEEIMAYGMIGYVVPHSIYPNGYHCDPKLQLPFINLASQKNFIALYATCVYGDSKLKEWFASEYPKYCKTKLDMGAGCIRFKKMDDIQYRLIGELAGKLTPQQWIEMCERIIKR